MADSVVSSMNSLAERAARKFDQLPVEAKIAISVGAGMLTGYIAWKAVRGLVADKSGAMPNPVQLNTYERRLKSELVEASLLRSTFDDIGGLDEQVTRVLEMLLPLRRPELFKNANLAKAATGCLLYGPPGTGKTLLAKAIAQECGASFLNISASTILSKWVGESERNVEAIFSLAYKMAPCIIFLDEVDGLLAKRGEASEHEVSRKIKTLFMTHWDGLGTEIAQERAARTAEPGKHWVTVIAATNRPWALDPAILRRLPLQIEVPLPDAAARRAILCKMLSAEHAEVSDEQLGAIAARTEGFSGSDLKELCRVASLQPVSQIAADERRAAGEFKRRAAELRSAIQAARKRGVAAASATAAAESGSLSCEDHDLASLLPIPPPPSLVQLSAAELTALLAARSDQYVRAATSHVRDMTADDLFSALAYVRPTGAQAEEYGAASGAALGFREHGMPHAARLNGEALLGGLQP